MASNDTLGMSFAPTFDNAELAKTAERPQESLEVLSFRLPKSPRIAGGFSPLAGDVSRGGPNMSVLESVFRTILGPDAAAVLVGGGGPTPGSTAASQAQAAPSTAPIGGAAPLVPPPTAPVIHPGVLPGPANRAVVEPTPDAPAAMPQFGGGVRRPGGFAREGLPTFA